MVEVSIDCLVQFEEQEHALQFANILENLIKATHMNVVQTPFKGELQINVAPEGMSDTNLFYNHKQYKEVTT